MTRCAAVSPRMQTTFCPSICVTAPSNPARYAAIPACQASSARHSSCFRASPRTTQDKFLSRAAKHGCHWSRDSAPLRPRCAIWTPSSKAVGKSHRHRQSCPLRQPEPRRRPLGARPPPQTQWRKRASQWSYRFTTTAASSSRQSRASSPRHSHRWRSSSSMTARLTTPLT